MSGFTIDKKIQAAFKKVGKIVGFNFAQYRANDFLDPLQERNFIANHKMAFSQDEGFSKNPADTLNYYKLYLSYGNVQPFDLLYSEELDETYAVLENTKLRGPVGVKCTHRIDVNRPVSTPALDKKMSLEEVATNFPCAVDFVSGGADSGMMTGIPSKLTTGSMNINVWIGVPVGTIKINDVITVGGNNYRVKSVSDYKVMAEAVKAGT